MSDENNSEVTPEAPGAGTSEAPSAAVEPEWLKLDPSNLKKGIDDLRASNPDFLNLFNSEVGNAAARRYKPEIEARDRQIEDYRKQIRKFEINSMDEKDIEAKIASDADFAKEWAELIHYSPPAQVEDPTPAITQMYEDMVTAATQRGVSQEFIDKATEKAAQGGYVGGPNESWQTQIRRFENDLVNEALRVAKDSASAPAVNNALLKGGPNASGSRHGGTDAFRAEFKTVREFKNLTADRRAEVIADPDGRKYVEELAAKG